MAKADPKARLQRNVAAIIGRRMSALPKTECLNECATTVDQQALICLRDRLNTVPTTNNAANAEVLGSGITVSCSDMP
jgi:hypothetical protein